MGLFRIDGEFEKIFEVKNFDTLHQDQKKKVGKIDMNMKLN